MKPTFKFHLLVPVLLALSLACSFSAATPDPQADPNAFNTQVALTAVARNSDPSAFNTSVAQTAAASTPFAIGGNTAVPPTVVLSPQAAGDEQAIKQALAAALGLDQSNLQVSVTANNGLTAYGTVVQNGAAGGAAWYAAKGADGKWIIVHTGQSWPPCAAIQPYNFPVNYVAICEDASGNIVDRASGGNSAPPSNPTAIPPTQADSFAPNPLDVAWTGFWIAQGECYDLDLFSAVNDATCDLKLDANNTFTPQNGATFNASPYQQAPSLNTCKSAALTTASMDAAQITYVCFKTNAGKYGFFIPREVQAGGVVFDAYVFP